jgi:hypothetical protein
VPSWPIVAGAVRAAVAPEVGAEPAAEAAAAEDVEAEPEPPAPAGEELEAEPAALDEEMPPPGVTVRFEIWSRPVSDLET